MNNKYNAADDLQFKEPYIDVQQQRTEQGVNYTYIHGGFKDTSLKFSFFFPNKAMYEGRFYHFMAPVQGSEDASIGRKGEESKIVFALTNGAYFIETNMGVAPFSATPDNTVFYRSSAAAAEYSRQVAQKFYDYKHRPYGYIFGGSGGGYKTMSCFECTNTWDGAVPYVIGSPMALPNVISIRGHATRILRDKFLQIADALEPGSTVSVYDDLNAEQKDCLQEVTKMGFPPKVWCIHDKLDAGSLPVLAPIVKSADSKFFEDFWATEGYLGADKNSSAVKDRLVFDTLIKQVFVPQTKKEKTEDKLTGVDEAWQRGRDDRDLVERPWVELEKYPKNITYLYGMLLIVKSGEAAGTAMPVEKIIDGKVIVAPGFGMTNLVEMLNKLKAGDKVCLDNSDLIAVNTYHRHQVPNASFKVWNQFRDKDGNPIFPQRPMLLGPKIASSSGSLQSGDFNGKMIVLAALMDECAFPWQADWYRKRVAEMHTDKEENFFRLWYIDNSLHDDQLFTIDELHTVPYLPALNQALLDIAKWVEQGIAPPKSTNYQVADGQVIVPESAKSRAGVQPVVKLLANGATRAEVAVGETVCFLASIEVPQGAGKIIKAEWSFNGKDYNAPAVLTDISEAGTMAIAKTTCSFNKKGTFYVVIRVYSERNGNQLSEFTKVKNLCRARVVVK